MLMVRRPGNARPMQFVLDPALVDAPSVERIFLLQAGVGYIRVNGFDPQTSKQFKDAVEKLGGAKLKGLVLDLRDNGGGVYRPHSKWLPICEARAEITQRERTQHRAQEVDYPVLRLMSRCLCITAGVIISARASRIGSHFECGLYHSPPLSRRSRTSPFNFAPAQFFQLRL